MKKKTKTLILSIVVTLVLLLTFTISYAVFSYMETGEDNQQLVLGDIYMHYQEVNALSIENAMPGDDYTEYFEFTISGKNTYTKQDIYYDVVLFEGDVPKGKTETNRIPDEYLKFKLVEVSDDDSETIIFTDKTYSDLTNKRIWVETIPKNTTDEYNKTYRIYMVISESLVIGNTSEAVYTSEEWNDVFASIKVNVTGDFNEKELAYEDKYNVTDGSCFTTKEVNNNNKYHLNTNMTEEELSICVNIFDDLGFREYLLEGETIETFCDGTGTLGGIKFQTIISDSDFLENSPELAILLRKNNIINVDLMIWGYDTLCGTDVVIPKTIDGGVVRFFGESALGGKNLTSVVIPDSVKDIGISAFAYNRLTSIVIPDSVTRIGTDAFNGNQLTSVVIPNSVTEIEYSAFANNQLEIVTIGSGIQNISRNAFYKSSTSNPNLKSITFTSKTCDQIKNIEESYVLNKYFPWLYDVAPYYQEGYKATIIGTDGVCEY